MYIGKYNETRDYPVLAKWWKGHGWTPVNKILLRSTGVVAFDENESQIAAGFLYHATETPSSYMEWVVADPNSDPRTVMKGLDMVIANIIDKADQQSRILHTSVLRKGLVRIYEKHGFCGVESGMTNLVRLGRWG